MSVDPSRKAEDGPVLLINCPLCRSQGVSATTWNLWEGVSLFFIPIRFYRTSWARCSHCNTTLLARRNVQEMRDLSPVELEKFIAPYVDLINRVLAILALLIGWVPLVGLIVALIAVGLNEQGGFWRRLSVIGLRISLVCHAGYGALMLYSYLT